MEKPVLVIINGLSGAGKSTLAFALAEQLSLPLLMRDQLKEVLFDELGWHDRAWSIKAGGASYELLFHLIERQLEAKKPAIVESPFYAKRHTARFIALKAKYGFEPVQIMCSASPEVLFERIHKRAKSGERHPGHVEDLGTYAQFLESLKDGQVGRLAIGGSLIEIDTTPSNWLDQQRLQEMVKIIQLNL